MRFLLVKTGLKIGLKIRCLFQGLKLNRACTARWVPVSVPVKRGGIVGTFRSAVPTPETWDDKGHTVAGVWDTRCRKNTRNNMDKKVA